MGMRDCKELREATEICLYEGVVSETDLATLAKLGSVLPALKSLLFHGTSGSGGPDGVLQLAEGLVAGALPAVTVLFIGGKHIAVGDAGASAIAAALDRGALPRLKGLHLMNTAIGDAAMVALAPALRRRPALEELNFFDNPFGDKGLAALVAPPLPAGGLKQLKKLHLNNTQITDAGCAAVAAALDSGTLPALKGLYLHDTHVSWGAAMEVFRRNRISLFT